LDRIDLHIDVPEVSYQELTGDPSGESSKLIARRVAKARNLQLRRFHSGKHSIFCNAQMGPAQIRKHCVLEEDTQKLLGNAIQKLGFSARAYDRILKMSRTLADLAGLENLSSEHVSEAIQYRSLDRNF